MRVAIVPVILLLALAGCAPTGGAPGTSFSASSTIDATPTPPPTADTPLEPCADGTITPQVNDAEGAAGHLNYQVEFVNSGPQCTLEGFPQVAVLGNGNGTQFGVVAEQMSEVLAEPVVLAEGASAYAWLEAVNIDPGGGPLGADCAVDYGDGWNIYVPGAIEPTFVPANGVPACTSGLPWMRIGPISES